MPFCEKGAKADNVLDEVDDQKLYIHALQVSVRKSTPSRKVEMIEANSSIPEPEYISQEEYRTSWLNVLLDEILLECYEGLL